ncbi:MAG: DNA-3-methyladenine glycosylase [Actinomycetota bacterium]
MSARSTLRPVARAFFSRPVLNVARDLIGAVLVHRTAEGRIAARIVETEAYGTEDPGSHAFRRQTARNAPMFEEPGHAYVYFTYGMHWCLNAVTDRAGVPGAVLIRAAEPIEGIELMRERRTEAQHRPRDENLARGPGRLTQAFGIGAEQNRADLTAPPLFVAPGERYPEEAVARGPRIGLAATQQDDRAWRFWLRDSRYVSGRRGAPRRVR